MGTEVTTANSAALAAANALRGNLSKARQSMPQQNSAYMRFGKDGSWVFGVENEEVLPEDRIAINPMSIKTGFSCWTDRDAKLKTKNEILGEVMFPLGTDVPHISTMAQKKDPKTGDICAWKEQTSVTMRFLDGPHKGKQVEYSTTSFGGLQAIGNVLDQIMLQLDEDPTLIVPVVALDGDHYMHKQWGKTYTPVIKIKDWIGMDAATAPVSEAAEALEVEAAVVDSTPEPDEVVEAEVVQPDEVADEEPVVRRRRR